jgi:hypothetical protein
MMLVRLKPHNPKQGNVLRTYTVFGIKFTAGRDWFQVDQDVADYLRQVQQESGTPNSPMAFNVCTQAEAEALDANESAAKAQTLAAPPSAALSATRVHAPTARRAAPDTGTLTTADLPTNQPAKPAAFDDQRAAFDDDMTSDAASVVELPKTQARPAARRK